MANEEKTYLEYFGLNRGSNINAKLVAFSSAVKDLYDKMQDTGEKIEESIPDEKCKLEEQIANLIILRNNIKKSRESIPNHISFKFDYICLKCMDNNADSAFNCRFADSYYLKGGRFDKRKVIKDIIPYLYPQMIEEALPSLVKMDEDNLLRTAEACAMLVHGFPFETIFKIAHVPIPQDKLFCKSVHIGDKAAEILFRCVKGGPDFFVFYNQELLRSLEILLTPELVINSDRTIATPVKEMHDKFDRELLGLSDVILNGVTKERTILISEVDYQKQDQVDGDSPLVKSFMQHFGRSKKVPIGGFIYSLHDSVVDLLLADGTILIELSNDNGQIKINLELPFFINEFQKGKLECIEKELNVIIEKLKTKNADKESIQNVSNAILEIQECILGLNEGKNGALLRTYLRSNRRHREGKQTGS